MHLATIFVLGITLALGAAAAPAAAPVANPEAQVGICSSLSSHNISLRAAVQQLTESSVYQFGTGIVKSIGNTIENIRFGSEQSRKNEIQRIRNIPSPLRTEDEFEREIDLSLTLLD